MKAVYVRTVCSLVSIVHVSVIVHILLCSLLGSSLFFRKNFLSNFRFNISAKSTVTTGNSPCSWPVLRDITLPHPLSDLCQHCLLGFLSPTVNLAILASILLVRFIWMLLWSALPEHFFCWQEPCGTVTVALLFLSPTAVAFPALVDD